MKFSHLRTRSNCYTHYLFFKFSVCTVQYINLCAVSCTHKYDLHRKSMIFKYFNGSYCCVTDRSELHHKIQLLSSHINLLKN